MCGWQDVGMVIRESSVVSFLPCLVTFFAIPSLHALSFLNDLHIGLPWLIYQYLLKTLVGFLLKLLQLGYMNTITAVGRHSHPTWTYRGDCLCNHGIIWICHWNFGSGKIVLEPKFPLKELVPRTISSSKIGPNPENFGPSSSFQQSWS